MTCGVLLAKKMDPKDAVAYVIAQVLGAIVAAALILFIAQGAASGFDVTAERTNRE